MPLLDMDARSAEEQNQALRHADNFFFEARYEPGNDSAGAQTSKRQFSRRLSFEELEKLILGQNLHARALQRRPALTSPRARRPDSRSFGLRFR